MQLKTSRRSLRGVFPRVAVTRVAAAGVLLAVALVLVLQTAPGAGLAARARDAARNAVEFARARVTADPPSLQIDLAHEHLQSLAAKRRTALAEGVLVSSPDDYVPARVRAGDREVRVDLRLKGDMSDHWEDEHKWSFRVRVKGDDTLLGMKQFSLQHPRTRAFASEWFMHEALRREGLPALRYDFVQLALNGRDLGIYAVEEHFEKRLIEHSGRREGPIVRFNEDLCWGEIRGAVTGPARDAACLGSGSGSYLAADADAFQTRRLLAAPASAGRVAKALQLLDGFRRGELSTRRAFDVPLLARYFAVLELLDRVHAGFWRNARFYYNPVTSRLEPIAFDGGSVGQPASGALVPALRGMHDTLDPNNYYYHLYYFDSLFRDRSFYARYVRELERVTAPGWLEDLLEELRAPLDEKLLVLHVEFPGVRLDEEALFARRREIRGWLSPPRLVHAHLQERTGEQVHLKVGNLQYLDVEILGLADAGGSQVSLEEPVRLPGRSASRAVSYTDVSLAVPPSEPDPSALTLRARILGSKKVRDSPLLPWPRTGAGELATDVLRAEPNAGSFDFAVVDAGAREVRLRPGVWFLRSDLVVPPSYRLRAGPGTELMLEAGALVVARGPVELVGTADSPVVLRSASGTGQGLLVLGAAEMSILEHVQFGKLRAAERDGLGITGAVTFYESPVTIRHCRFEASGAEDALNLVRSPFTIEASVFRDSASDALDIDFSEGRVADTAFVASGNDAVDVSGSAVRLERLRLTLSGDKGISAGERSEVRGKEIRVVGAKVGVASKDLSRVVLEGLYIRDARVGLAAFQKKSEFGGAHLDVSALELAGVETATLAERGSGIFVDGERAPAADEGVRALLYDAD